MIMGIMAHALYYRPCAFSHDYLNTTHYAAFYVPNNVVVE